MKFFCGYMHVTGPWVGLFAHVLALVSIAGDDEPPADSADDPQCGVLSRLLRVRRNVTAFDDRVGSDADPVDSVGVLDGAVVPAFAGSSVRLYHLRV
ncbi:MAG: hypothetical protein WCQ63_03360 [Methanomethylophilus sp.]